MTKPALPVDIYVRVSRVGSRDPESLRSPLDQEREARAFAQTKGLAVGEVLQDIDKPGANLERPGLQKALQRIEAGTSGGIVVAYLSRATRDTQTGLELLAQITTAGGSVYAPNLPDYTTADGRMLTTIQLAIDTGYRMRKTAELETAKENAIKSGIPVHSRPPPGLRPIDPKNKIRQLEADPAVVPIIVELFERRAAGEGPATLGEFLTANGVKTSQGSTVWTRQAVYGLIKNRIYLGELSYGRDRPDGGYVNPSAFPPLVDAAAWHAAQHPNGRQLQRPKSPKSYLLTGLARCAACGYSLQATSHRGHRIYRCTRTHAGGICPEPTRADAEPLEELAIAVFWAIAEDREALGQEKQDDSSGELARLEEEFVRTERHLSDWSSPAVQNEIGDLALFAAGLRERREARDVLAVRLADLRSVSVDPRSLPDVATLRGAWDAMTRHEQREMLALGLDCLALRRDGGVVVYPKGLAPAGLPRQGFARNPKLVPFPDPPNGARMLSL